MSSSSSLVGKPLPDMAGVLVSNPSTKVSLKKLMEKGKRMVICFVSKTQSPVETNAAVQKMEEGKFQVKDKAVFVIVSLDFQKAAQELHAEQAIRKCIHVFASTQGKELSIVRTPAHFVIAADGKVLMATEEEVAPYMSLVL